MGGRFGEMSTLMNYTFQSFNLRGRQAARPFYDLVANIAAEEYGHIELVAATINTMLTGASPAANGRPPGDALTGVKNVRNTYHFIAGGQGALPQDSMGKPWNGDYVFSSGDLVEDLTHKFFLETSARNNKLKVYEMVDHPAARALTGYLLVRGGVHQVAYARALEHLTGADLTKLFPTPRIPTEKIPECQPHIKKGEHLKLYGSRRATTARSSRSSTARTPRPARTWSLSTRPRRARRHTTCRRSRRCSHLTTRPPRSPRSPSGCARTPGFRRSPSARSRTAAPSRSRRLRNGGRGRCSAPLQPPVLTKRAWTACRRWTLAS